MSEISGRRYEVCLPFLSCGSRQEASTAWISPNWPSSTIRFVTRYDSSSAEHQCRGPAKLPFIVVLTSSREREQEFEMRLRYRFGHHFLRSQDVHRNRFLAHDMLESVDQLMKEVDLLRLLLCITYQIEIECETDQRRMRSRCRRNENSLSTGVLHTFLWVCKELHRRRQVCCRPLVGSRFGVADGYELYTWLFESEDLGSESTKAS
jgi:hypothetical protein